MDRSAIFVDAGYLYAEGGKLCCGGPSRKFVQLDGLQARDVLVGLTTRASGLPTLRMYWYDGARDGIPTTPQQQIAALPNVKLRLGRLNGHGQQKGVDALIYRDLMTLARERAISDAFLLSGDEDLREGVRAAQDMGVRVTLIGIVPASGGWNQSRELVNEADEVVQLTRADVSKFISRQEVPTGGTLDGAAKRDHVVKAAINHAEQWLGRSTDDELAALLANRPRIPALLDSNLLAAVENQIGGSLRENEKLRRAARGAFWDRIAEDGPAARTAPSDCGQQALG